LWFTWPLTPFRELTLVHACQQPLLDPVITALTASRDPGATGAALSGQVQLDVASTAKVELLASWTDPPVPGQRAAASAAHVLTVPLPPARAPGQFRILVTEYELLDSDANALYSYQTSAPPDAPPGTPKTFTVAAYYRPGSRRLVFAEEIII
jgi:hypothetical protein